MWLTRHRTFEVKTYRKDDNDDTDRCFPLDLITPLMTRIAECWQTQLKPLTNHFAEEGRSGAGRQVDANEVDWCTRQCHCNSHQRVDGITVEGNHYEENAAQAVDYWEEQRQLQGVETGRWQRQREKKGEAEKRNGRWEQWEEKKKAGRLKLKITLTNTQLDQPILLMI